MVDQLEKQFKDVDRREYYKELLSAKLDNAGRYSDKFCMNISKFFFYLIILIYTFMECTNSAIVS